jgi:hypothetical protein
MTWGTDLDKAKRRGVSRVNTRRDTTRYVIKYTTFHPGLRSTHLPTQTTTARGWHNRNITVQSIKAAGGKVTSVRTAWF